MRMPFGKYCDVELTKVPRPYLRWLRRQDWVGKWLVQAIDETLGGGPVAAAEGAGEHAAGGPPPPATFWVRQSGNVGQEIIDQDGRVIAWTTDDWTARVICKLLNENEGLLRGKAGHGAP
jgi:hypothetical protein